MATYTDYGQGGANAFPLPVGTSGTPFAQTFDRRLVNNITFAPTTGTMYVTAIWLPAEMTVSGITFVSGATAESGGSHLFYALYSRNPVSAVCTLMAQAADNGGGAAFGANTAFRMALTTAQKLTYSGFYYLAFACTGTTPTLYNITNTGINANGNIAGMTPILAASADAVTTTAPSTLGALTTVTAALYAFVD